VTDVLRDSWRLRTIQLSFPQASGVWRRPAELVCCFSKAAHERRIDSLGDVEQVKRGTIRPARISLTH
jgi:hypothetical protein